MTGGIAHAVIWRIESPFVREFMRSSKPQIADGVIGWLLEDGYPGRLQTEIEKKGKPSKWLALTVLRVLKWIGSS